MGSFMIGAPCWVWDLKRGPDLENYPYGGRKEIDSWDSANSNRLRTLDLVAFFGYSLTVHTRGRDFIRNKGTKIQAIGHAVLQHFGLQISLVNQGRVAAGLRILGWFRV